MSSSPAPATANSPTPIIHQLCVDVISAEGQLLYRLHERLNRVVGSFISIGAILYQDDLTKGLVPIRKILGVNEWCVDPQKPALTPLFFETRNDRVHMHSSIGLTKPTDYVIFCGAFYKQVQVNAALAARRPGLEGWTPETWILVPDTTTDSGKLVTKSTSGKRGMGFSYKQAQKEAQAKRLKALEPAEKKMEEYIYFKRQDANGCGDCNAYAVPVTVLAKFDVTLEYIDKEMATLEEEDRWKTLAPPCEDSLFNNLIQHAETNVDSGIVKLDEDETVPLHKFNFVRIYLPYN